MISCAESTPWAVICQKPGVANVVVMLTLPLLSAVVWSSAVAVLSGDVVQAETISPGLKPVAVKVTGEWTVAAVAVVDGVVAVPGSDPPGTDALLPPTT